MKPRKGSHAVLIVITPADWKPTHWHAIPFAIEGGYFLARRLKFPEAIKLAKEFNKAHLPCRSGTVDHEWALCIKNLRASKWQGPTPIQAKGGTP